MSPGRALLLSGAFVLLGTILLGGVFLASRITAASLGFAMVLVIPVGAMSVLVGLVGLLFGLVAYIVGDDRHNADQRALEGPSPPTGPPPPDRGDRVIEKGKP